MVKAPSKSDTLYGRMRADILSLGLAPGSALRLPALSERYAIGLTPLRECLNRLSAEKLVVTEHNKGFRVAPLSANDLLDLERSRSAIEGTLFVQAVRNGDDGWQAGVIGAYYHLSHTAVPSVLLSSDDLALWATRHDAFHASLIKAATSPWMHHFRTQLNDQLGRYQLFIQTGLRELAATHPDIAASAANVFATAMALEPHTALYDIAMRRNAEDARATFEAHANLSIQAFEKLSALLPAEAKVVGAFGQITREVHP
ncbi:GntR family transcriptional regulator [Roseobacter weihaiensis]|uniref:GntR family transcriptional regulator n=1 Tax=Roseobacter weihaiensis TaxID=2763262 RepID=UPI001D0AD9BC|nr:GntR family transcriptional regulator [Roseobacter sp. H9]